MRADRGASHTTSFHTLEAWIAREAIPFSLESPSRFDAAVDEVIAALGAEVEVLGLGEPFHGGSELLLLRNRLFRRLVEAHGFSAVAIESSFPRAHVVNEHVSGRGPTSYDTIAETGFSHGFGRLAANRELVEWMRRHNADLSCRVPLRFYGFDSPTEMMGTDSPRRLLLFTLDALASIDAPTSDEYRRRIEPLLGEDADWDNPAAMMDPTQSIGRSPTAAALRIETEELISALTVRRPEFVAQTGSDRYLEAVQHTSLARQMLTYHAALATASPNRTATLLGLRDAMMADNLAYALSRERGRGKVLAFAHNSHLQRGPSRWTLGGEELIWWPAGAHLEATLGSCYAVIGTAVGVVDAMGIGQPEPGTLEALLTAANGPARLVPTHRGQGLPSADIAALPTRSGHPAYFPLTPQSGTDFDWLAILDATGYDPGAPPQPR